MTSAGRTTAKQSELSDFTLRHTLQQHPQLPADVGFDFVVEQGFVTDP